MKYLAALPVALAAIGLAGCSSEPTITATKIEVQEFEFDIQVADQPA